MPPPLAALSPEELRTVSESTVSHYDQRADAFRAGTMDHDVSQNVDALLRHLPGPAPQRLLDLGCGPGRDLATFVRHGHTPVGLDGAEAFVAMARALLPPGGAAARPATVACDRVACMLTAGSG